ncbi:hypothetical protein [Haloarchaeobius sp. DYHT-AS-18]|uniref:hypothetical protein n=1 Tax=Haloarchaeobius sp. DYHT-AS-18 TaxID=3446117 RepID=UPI003EBA90F8
MANQEANRSGRAEATSADVEGSGGTDSEPKSVTTRCIHCESTNATVLIPRDSNLSESHEKADGKVWGNCRSCGERFDVYFRKN